MKFLFASFCNIKTGKKELRLSNRTALSNRDGYSDEKFQGFKDQILKNSRGDDQNDPKLPQSTLDKSLKKIKIK